jgi:2'-hydroxyisoflavone reductase
MAGRILNMRPGLICGPYGPTDRFTYWPRRISAGGEVLVPDPPERRVQFIDVRDLAGWIVKMSTEQQTGTYNATGPDYELRMGQLLEECEATSGGDAKIVWVFKEFLEQNGVEPFTELPLWVPREYAGMLAVDYGRAIAAGLTFRPVSETIRDVLEWESMRAADAQVSAGLTPERERELLLAWHGANL